MRAGRLESEGREREVHTNRRLGQIKREAEGVNLEIYSLLCWTWQDIQRTISLGKSNGERFVCVCGGA